MNLYRVEWMSNSSPASTWTKARTWREAVGEVKADWPGGTGFLAHDLGLSAHSRIIELREQGANL